MLTLEILIGKLDLLDKQLGDGLNITYRIKKRKTNSVILLFKSQEDLDAATKAYNDLIVE